MRRDAVEVALLACLASGCIDRSAILTEPDAVMVGPDARALEAGVDAGRDARVNDTGIDAVVTLVDGGDVGPIDSGTDADLDASFADGGFDAGVDGGPMPIDSGVDAFVAIDANRDATSPVCLSNSVSCLNANTLRTCNAAGTANIDTTCALGCNGAAPARCNILNPANVDEVLDSTYFMGAPAVSINAGATIDTSSCTGFGVTRLTAPTTGGSFCVAVVDSLRVTNAATLRVQGIRPLIVVSRTTIVVDMNASIAVLPGDARGGAVDSGSGTGNAGGAGGSLCGMGGNGGSGMSGGVGLARGISSAIQPLSGGVGGGSSGMNRGGGGGGGAIQLVALESVTVNGRIRLPGGGGAGGLIMGDGGGGGGSGGFLFIESPVVSLAPSAVNVRGGGGGGGACTTFGLDGNAGSDPMASLGGTGGACGSGNGGNGAATTLDGTAGESNAIAGGGGGGGAGCVYVRTLDVLPSNSSVQPSVTGVVAGAGLASQ